MITFSDDQPPESSQTPQALPLWHALRETLADESRPQGERHYALRQLSPYLHDSPALLSWTIEWVRSCTHITLLTTAVEVLAQVRMQASVAFLLDVALGIRCHYFEQPNNYTQLMQQEEVLRLRCQAIKLLGFLQNDDATTVLMALLNDRQLNYRIRLEAAEALGRLRQPQALNPLVQILKDEREPSLYLKESAAKALGLLGDIRAIEPLMDVFEAQQGFRKKCEFVMEQLVTSLGKLLPMGGDVSSQTQKKAHHHLVDALKDTASSIRIAGLEALSDVGDEAYGEMVRPLLWDEHMDVAHTALATLYKLSGTEALRALLNEEELPQFLREEILDFLLLEAQEELDSLDDVDRMLEGVDDVFLEDIEIPDSFSFDAWKQQQSPSSPSSSTTRPSPHPDEDSPLA